MSTLELSPSVIGGVKINGGTLEYTCLTVKNKALFLPDAKLSRYKFIVNELFESIP